MRPGSPMKMKTISAFLFSFFYYIFQWHGRNDDTECNENVKEYLTIFSVLLFISQWRDPNRTKRTNKNKKITFSQFYLFLASQQHDAYLAKDFYLNGKDNRILHFLLPSTIPGNSIQIQKTSTFFFIVYQQ